jgi:hypothetical protein
MITKKYIYNISSPLQYNPIHLSSFYYFLLLSSFLFSVLHARKQRQREGESETKMRDRVRERCERLREMRTERERVAGKRGSNGSVGCNPPDPGVKSATRSFSGEVQHDSGEAKPKSDGLKADFRRAMCFPAKPRRPVQPDPLKPLTH